MSGPGATVLKLLRYDPVTGDFMDVFVAAGLGINGTTIVLLVPVPRADLQKDGAGVPGPQATEPF